MPRFEPFAGTRYDPEYFDYAAVTAPPYDVIDAEQRARLAARSPYNVVHVDLPHREDGGDIYDAAGCSFDEWLEKEVLLEDEPSFYVYRMGYHDEQGRARQTAGVIGAMELAVPGEGDVLPHERTMSKPKDDRLNLMRSCRANLSPVWGLSMASGLTALCELPGPPDARCTDDDGVHHRIWRIGSAGVLSAISDVVGSAPVVIADGHHRYETALAYQAERRAADGDRPGDYDLLMIYVVELAEEQLAVRPIHRLLRGLDGDVRARFEPFFELFEAPADGDLTAAMADAGALALLLPDGTWLLRPRPDAFADLDEPTDSMLLDRALESFPAVDRSFHHDPAEVARQVDKGDAEAGVLLRPATVAQISAVARARRRMPEKTTFFAPKPRTGMVFRRLQD